MSTTTTVATRARVPGRTLPARLAGVAGAVAAPLALWALGTSVLGWEYWAPAVGGQPAHEIGPGIVMLAAGVASLAGWAFLEILERLTGRRF